MSWRLDPRIDAASAYVADLPLCQARLQDDIRWPWLVLIPRRPDAQELDDLDGDERRRLLDEITLAIAAVRRLGEAQGRPVDKLNVGALGNVVPQLHVHVVGRRHDDPAWPGPVWGFGEPRPPAAQARDDGVRLARELLHES